MKNVPPVVVTLDLILLMHLIKEIWTKTTPINNVLIKKTELLYNIGLVLYFVFLGQKNKINLNSPFNLSLARPLLPGAAHQQTLRHVCPMYFIIEWRKHLGETTTWICLAATRDKHGGRTWRKRNNNVGVCQSWLCGGQLMLQPLLLALLLYKRASMLTVCFGTATPWRILMLC